MYIHKQTLPPSMVCSSNQKLDVTGDPSPITENRGPGKEKQWGPFKAYSFVAQRRGWLPALRKDPDIIDLVEKILAVKRTPNWTGRGG